MKSSIIALFTILIAFSLIASSPSSINAQQPTKEARKEKIAEVKSKLRKSGRIIGSQVTAITGTTLSVTKDSKTYTVNTDANTRFRRHFWGKSSISEISVGDNVNVWGTWTDENQTIISAKLIRDTSVMKRFGVFIGQVKSKDTSSFVLTATIRGDQTVLFDINTKFTNIKSASINYSDVNVGDKVRVKGMWDKTLYKITDVKEVKDFSLPPRPTVSPAK